MANGVNVNLQKLFESCVLKAVPNVSNSPWNTAWDCIAAVSCVIVDRSFVSLMLQAWPLLSLNKAQLDAAYLRQHIVDTAGIQFAFSTSYICLGVAPALPPLFAAIADKLPSWNQSLNYRLESLIFFTAATNSLSTANDLMWLEFTRMSIVIKARLDSMTSPSHSTAGSF